MHNNRNIVTDYLFINKIIILLLLNYYYSIIASVYLVYSVKQSILKNNDESQTCLAKAHPINALHSYSIFTQWIYRENPLSTELVQDFFL